MRKGRRRDENRLKTLSSLSPRLVVAKREGVGRESALSLAGALLGALFRGSDVRGAVVSCFNNRLDGRGGGEWGKRERREKRWNGC